MPGDPENGAPNPDAAPIAPAQNVAPQQAAAPAKEESIAKPIEGAARHYLHGLLEDIATMLSFASASGISLPEDLRSKISTLVSDPQVADDSAAEKFASLR